MRWNVGHEKYKCQMLQDFVALSYQDFLKELIQGNAVRTFPKKKISNEISGKSEQKEE